MKRRAEAELASIPDWLLSPAGRLLVEAPVWIGWCEANGWAKLDVLLEAQRRRRAAFGVAS